MIRDLDRLILDEEMPVGVSPGLAEKEDHRQNPKPKNPSLHKFSFFDLPPELRFKIYEECLVLKQGSFLIMEHSVTNGAHPNGYGTPVNFEDWRQRRAERSSTISGRSQPYPFKVPINLIRVSKKINKEAIPFLYSKNKFDFAWIYFQGFAQRCNLISLEMMTSIELPFPLKAVTWTYNSWADDTSVLLNTLKNLQTLTLLTKDLRHQDVTSSKCWLNQIPDRCTVKVKDRWIPRAGWNAIGKRQPTLDPEARQAFENLGWLVSEDFGNEGDEPTNRVIGCRVRTYRCKEIVVSDFELCGNNSCKVRHAESVGQCPINLGSTHT